MLQATTASHYARTGLDNVAREYPNHPGQLLTGPDDLLEPHRRHPLFYGSYDWHSSVHQHWMLVRLLRRHPELPERHAIHAWFDERWTPGAVDTEVAFFEGSPHRTFERPYGWAWLLRLAAELTAWGRSTEKDAPAARRWGEVIEPLRRLLRDRAIEWLARTPYPHRAGAHANSAYAARLLAEAADVHADLRLRSAVEDAATRWYLDDRAAPTRYEPSAADFLSPSLVEVDLMAQVLAPDTYLTWLDGFLTDPEPLLTPAQVVDRTDPHTVHLDGLNLSRAWCWLRLAAALPPTDPRRASARTAAWAHADASLPHVLVDYAGSHWLPTFAVHLADVELATRDARGG